MAPELAMSVELVPVLHADWDAPAHVRAFNTTRLGGVSTAPYDSLNLGLHVSDNAASVRENRARLYQAQNLPSEPRWLHQVHGCDVLDLSTGSGAQIDNLADAQNQSSNQADAAFTDQPNQVLCVVTADCLPVVITNNEGTELAVAHAGWKGLVNGVLEASLAKFSATSQFHVWLGPAIGPEKFEVGLEVKAAFVSKDVAHETAFVSSTTDPQKAYADIYALARQTIQRQLSSLPTDVSISGGNRCTLTESEHFHSYRRDGAASGRMALVAWLAS